MKKPLVSFEITCDRCGKSHQCINKVEDYLPTEWTLEPIKSTTNTQPAGPVYSSGATGSISYGSSGSTSVNWHAGPIYGVVRSGPQIGNIVEMEYLCPDCHRIKDILE